MRDPQNERPRNSIGGFAFLVFRLRFRRFWLGCLRHAAIPGMARMGKVEISYLFNTLSRHSCANDAESREDHTAQRETQKEAGLAKAKFVSVIGFAFGFCFGQVYASPDFLRIKDVSIKSGQNKRQAKTLCHTHAHLGET